MSREDRGTSMMTSEEESLLTRLVDRDVREIKPRIGPEGVTYEGLEDITEEYGKQRLHQLLESLTDKGFLIVEEHDRAVFCPNCGSPHIYSKYTCSRCNSTRVRRIELIEHQYCGFMGGRDNFISGSSLVCPNCNTNLGPVGGKPPRDGSKRDYKIIGSSFECEKCGCKFDRSNVLHVCQNCAANFNYRTAGYEKIYAYEIPEQVLEILGRIPQINMVLNPLEAALAEKGYKVERDVWLEGLSGGKHEFDIIALKDLGLVVVDISIGGSQDDVVSLLGKKMDVNPDLAVLIDMSGSEEVSALGKVYNILVLNGKDANLEKAFIDHIDGLKIRKAAKAWQIVDLKKKD